MRSDERAIVRCTPTDISVPTDSRADRSPSPPPRKLGRGVQKVGEASGFTRREMALDRPEDRGGLERGAVLGL